MNRRQVLQAVPALAAVALLPSIAWAEPELELPPTLKMEDVQESWVTEKLYPPGSYKPNFRTLRGYWQPYGDDVYITTHLTALYQPIWWPRSVPTWGPDNDADFLAYFKEKVARDYEESRLFFERSGLGWVKANITGKVKYPHQGWLRIRGVWQLQANAPGPARKYQYTEAERALIEVAEREWAAR